EQSYARRITCFARQRKCQRTSSRAGSEYDDVEIRCFHRTYFTHMCAPGVSAESSEGPDVPDSEDCLTQRHRGTVDLAYFQCEGKRRKALSDKQFSDRMAGVETLWSCVVNIDPGECCSRPSIGLVRSRH